MVCTVRSAALHAASCTNNLSPPRLCADLVTVAMIGSADPAAATFPDWVSRNMAVQVSVVDMRRSCCAAAAHHAAPMLFHQERQCIWLLALETMKHMPWCICWRVATRISRSGGEFISSRLAHASSQLSSLGWRGVSQNPHS